MVYKIFAKVDISDDVKRAFKSKLASEEKSLKDFLKQAIEDYSREISRI